jgi:hypothetical protein
MTTWLDRFLASRPDPSQTPPANFGNYGNFGDGRTGQSQDYTPEHGRTEDIYPTASIMECFARKGRNSGCRYSAAEFAEFAENAPTAPHWTDDRAWIRDVRNGPDHQAKLAILTAWVESAEGRVTNGTAHLAPLQPPQQRRLAELELRRTLRQHGLDVVDLCSPRGRRA